MASSKPIEGDEIFPLTYPCRPHVSILFCNAKFWNFTLSLQSLDFDHCCGLRSTNHFPYALELSETFSKSQCHRMLTKMLWSEGLLSHCFPNYCFLTAGHSSSPHLPICYTVHCLTSLCHLILFLTVKVGHIFPPHTYVPFQYRWYLLSSKWDHIACVYMHSSFTLIIAVTDQRIWRRSRHLVNSRCACGSGLLPPGLHFLFPFF